MRDSLGDKARVSHIIEAICEIEHYIEGANIVEFENNSMRRLATVKQLEIIGEAVTRLSPNLTDQFQEIEWKKIKGLRNILVHEYFGIDALLIWQIVQHDLPAFKSSKCRKLWKYNLPLPLVLASSEDAVTPSLRLAHHVGLRVAY